jgi:hypothetical protein
MNNTSLLFNEKRTWTCDDHKEKPLLFLPLTVVPNHQEILNIQEQC